MNRTPKGPFTIKDAKKVFPGLADGVVQKWRDKGYVTGNPIKRGLSVEIQYDIYQVVHLNVVNQLSILGMYQRNADLTVYVLPLMDHCSLTDPQEIEQILNAYAQLDIQAVLSVEIAEEAISDASYRNRRAIVKYIMSLGEMDILFPPGKFILGTNIPGTLELTYTTAQIRVGMMLARAREILSK